MIQVRAQTRCWKTGIVYSFAASLRPGSWSLCICNCMLCRIRLREMLAASLIGNGVISQWAWSSMCLAPANWTLFWGKTTICKDCTRHLEHDISPCLLLLRSTWQLQSKQSQRTCMLCNVVIDHACQFLPSCRLSNLLCTSHLLMLLVHDPFRLNVGAREIPACFFLRTAWQGSVRTQSWYCDWSFQSAHIRVLVPARTTVQDADCNRDLCLQKHCKLPVPRE